MDARFGRRRSLQWAIAGASAALVAACTPYELVLRHSAIDWDRMGVASVAVVAVAPFPVLAEASESATSSSSSARTLAIGEISATGDADVTFLGTASAPVSARASMSLPTPKATSSTDLAQMSREATELLTFALRESAMDVEKPGAGMPRLEVAVTDIGLVTTPDSTDDDVPPEQGMPSLRTQMGYSAYDPGSQSMRARLVVRLVEPGKTKPLWAKEAIGMVEYEKPEGLFGALDASSSDSLNADTLALLREIAVRRALRQVLDELLPRYEYQELRQP